VPTRRSAKASVSPGNEERGRDRDQRCLPHTAAVLGISVVLRLYPSAFKLMLLAGAAYIAWIGVSIIRRASVVRIDPKAAARSPLTAYRQGMLSNLLNPTAYLFTLAVIPQFLRAGDGPRRGERLAECMKRKWGRS